MNLATSENVSVGQAVMTVLRGYGIDTVWGIPGTHNLELYRPLSQLGIRAVTTRHEQGAGYAADAWAQRTGRPGVIITTSGPGLLNVLSAAATSYCESRPLLVLSPGAPTGQEYTDLGSLHETKDPTAASAAVMEWSRRVSSGAEALDAVHDAFRLFRTGRPRPMHIEIPMDLLETKIDRDSTSMRVPEAPALRTADTEAVTRAAQALAVARQPIIIAGGGAVLGAGAVRHIAERLHAPVLTSLNGKGVLSEQHPLSLGSELRLPTAHQLINDADVVLVIGSKLGSAELWDAEIAPRGTVVRVDISESQLNANVACDIGLIGSSAAVLEQLVAALALESVDTAEIDCELLRARLRDEAAAIAPAVFRLAQDIVSGLPADAIVTGDSSQITYLGIGSAFCAREPRSLLYMPTYATLGYGLPAAIGAKIADPDQPVVAILGDGALMFAVQEFATAVEQSLDLVVVCVDNGGYGEIRQNELDRGIAPIGVDLVQPDWVALVDAFGGSGRRVAQGQRVADAVRDAISGGGLQLIHVPFAAAGEGSETHRDDQGDKL